MLVGRGVLRNPWILAQAADIASGRAARTVSFRERGEFLLAYIQLLLNEASTRRTGSAMSLPARQPTRKMTDGPHAVTNGGSSTSFARCVQYSKDSTADRQLRLRVNSAERISISTRLLKSSFSKKK